MTTDLGKTDMEDAEDYWNSLLAEENPGFNLARSNGSKPTDDNQPHDPAQPGGQFILDSPSDVPAIWGKDDDVLWAEGESLMIAGPQGLCKTTLAGQLLRAQLGLNDSVLVLGLPVRDLGTKILYLAMDRPRQVARSMQRQFKEADRKVLDQRLIVRPGPPTADLAANPTLLLGMAQQYGAGVVWVDSVKDAAVGLAKDEVAAAYNRARQYLLLEGIELAELHHTRKSSGESGSEPKSIDAIFGSTWLTSGCGSVIMLTGEPGDLIIGFRHLKPPCDSVGPWTLAYNPDAGEVRISHQVDLLDIAAASGINGLTAKDAAMAMFSTEKPKPNEIEKARRLLNKKVTDGVLVRMEGSKGGRPDEGSAAWFPAA